MKEFEWKDTQDVLKERIKELEDLQDKDEQEYYRKKIALSTEYETKQAMYVKERYFLREWLRFEEWQNATLPPKD